MGQSLLKNATSMSTDKYTLSSKMGSGILSALGSGSTNFNKMYGNGNTYDILRIEFKVPVVIDGIKFTQSRDTLGSNWYRIEGVQIGSLSDNASVTFAPRKVKNLTIERVISGGYDTIDYAISVSKLEIFGAYELQLLEIDGKLFTIDSASNITFVSDNLDAPVSLFMSKGFTIDRLNSSMMDKLASFTKGYKIRTLKL